MPNYPNTRILCLPGKNGHEKASKNGMNRNISLIYENQSHLFHSKSVNLETFKNLITAKCSYLRYLCCDKKW